ncbi:MAG: CehA/McbA family metallohydrolase [bacterium]
MSRLNLHIPILTAMFLLAPGVSFSAPSGCDELAGALVHKYSYLLSSNEKQSLDSINRDLREAKEQIKSADTNAAKQEANQRYEKAAAQLLTLLPGLDSIIQITLQKDRSECSVQSPIELPGDAGALLFNISSGDDGTRCAVASEDLSQNSEAVVPLSIEPTGTTWALVGLKSVPAGKIEVRLRLARDGIDDIYIPIFVRTPLTGFLRVSVLSDDTGKPAPAMVRLISKMDGTDRKPSNAIDFAPQFDSQGAASGRRKAILPGSLAGYYWCVPGPFSMAVPPGEWEITVRRGLEHVPITETLHVESGQVVEEIYRPQRWVDMRDYGWYSGDDHVHCQILSDSDAENLMAWVQAEDIHLANVVKMGDIHRTWFEQRGFGKEFRVIADDYILSPGQECPRTHNELGHTISMNTTSMVRDTEKYFLYDWVFDTVHSQGGLSGYAHVLMDLFYVHRDMSINIPKGKVDFVELMQFGKLGTELFYEFLNLGYKVTTSAGSDVPWGGTIGEERVYAFIGDNPFSADAWFEAMKRGRTFVTNGPMLELSVDDAFPGDEIQITENQKLHVRARAWGDPRRMVPVNLEIVQHGEVIRKAENDNTAKAELELEFELGGAYGFWIAARAEGSDGTKAHTTPIYVTRDPYRFWKHDGIEERINNRLAALDEVEKVISAAETAIQEGQRNLTRTQIELVAQAEELRTRLSDARSIYISLREIAADEQKKRMK